MESHVPLFIFYSLHHFKTRFQCYLLVSTYLKPFHRAELLSNELIALPQDQLCSIIIIIILDHIIIIIYHVIMYIYHIIICFSLDCKLHEDRITSASSASLPQICRPVLTYNVCHKLSRNALLSAFLLDIVRGESINY